MLSARIRQWIYLTALVLVLDQYTKTYILSNYGLQQKIPLMPFFNISLSLNRGAAFGFLADSGGWQRWLFVGIASIISIIVFVWTVKLNKKDRLEGIALSCVLGGALGNLIDRIRHGFVVDFIDFYVKDWHWYTFNVADAAICVGAFLLIMVSVKKG